MEAIQDIILVLHVMEQAGKRMSAGGKDKRYTNSEIAKAIDEYVHSERDRKILKRRYIDGIRYEPLAEEFELSVRQIKNIIYKHEKTLF